jgi:hypothetical protein
MKVARSRETLGTRMTDYLLFAVAHVVCAHISEVKNTHFERSMQLPEARYT